jgi:hypothetical protein
MRHTSMTKIVSDSSSRSTVGPTPRAACAKKMITEPPVARSHRGLPERELPSVLAQTLELLTRRLKDSKP